MVALPLFLLLQRARKQTQVVPVPAAHLLMRQEDLADVEIPTPIHGLLRAVRQQRQIRCVQGLIQ